MDMGNQIIQMNENTWRIEEQGVRFFLLTGSEKALLIDSGMMTRNAKEIAEGLTNLPIELLNTHADPDHIGSNHQFEAPYMHPSETSNYFNSQKRQGKITPVWDGDVLDLGERELQIIALPGHTPGSVAVLDKKYRALFSGDPVQDGNIFMFGVQRDLCAYRHSLKRLQTMEDQFDVIYPSHGTIPVSKNYIQELIDGAEKVMKGEVEFTNSSFHGMQIKVYDIGIARFLGEMK